MNELMRNLFELQSLEFEATPPPDSDERIASLRAKIPKPILSHYDRLGDQGKRGVAILRNQVCTGCHMNVPIGVVLDLKRGEDVCLCGNCGRYLHLPEETAAVDMSLTTKKTLKTGRRRKELAHAL
jgi:hypothetical protein